MNTRTDENAIQSDATTQQEIENSDLETSEAAQISPRMAAMEAIAASRRDSLAEDGVDVSQMGGGAKVAAIDPDADPDNQLAAQLGADERPTNYAADGLMVKVKIDGEEMELPVSEVVKSYQKDQTASRRLTEATRLLQIAEQQANKVAQNNEQENNSPNATGDEGKEGRLSAIKGAFSKLYEGDEEGAADAMLQILEQGAGKATQNVDPAQIATQVRQQLAVESAYSEVKSDYPALFANDERGVVLGNETFARMNAKEASGVPRSQALQESVEEVARLFGIQKAGRQSTDTERTARDEKLARKAVLDIPRSANVVAGNGNSPAEAPNVSSVIAEMARSRLGQSMSPR
ncbi:MAG: hypothetical protein WC023_01510 [Rhodocyclaceae bacterium]